MRILILVLMVLICLGAPLPGRAQETVSPELFALFESAYWCLCTADHEYAGHRLKAAYQLQIFARHNSLGVTLPSVTYSVRGNLPYPSSVKRMNSALEKLEKFESVAGNAHVEHVTKAIKEIRLALEEKGNPEDQSPNEPKVFHPGTTDLNR